MYIEMYKCDICKINFELDDPDIRGYDMRELNDPDQPTFKRLMHFMKNDDAPNHICTHCFDAIKRRPELPIRGAH